MPRFTTFRTLALVALCTGSLACDGGDDGDSGMDAASDSAMTTADTTDTTDSTTGGGGACDPATAATPCGDACAFDPTMVDCMNACQNVADKCSDPACEASDQCVGLNQDVALCAAGCEGTKTLTCTNVVMGCWDTQGGTASCEDVGTCVQNNS